MTRTFPQPGHFIFLPANSSFAWSRLPHSQPNGIAMTCFSTAGSPRVTNRGLQPVLTLSAARENWQDFSARHGSA